MRRTNPNGAFRRVQSPTSGSSQLWHALPAAIGLSGRVDQVEIKAILDSGLATVMALIGPAVGKPVRRRIHYLDTPDLALAHHGLVVRTRETHGVCDDVAVRLRRSPCRDRSRGLTVELDALPSSTIWSASLARRLPTGQVRRAAARRRPARHLLSRAQRELLVSVTGAGIDVDGLVVLGPVDVVRLTSGRPGRRVVVESWGFPDGSGIVELSAKCRPARSTRTAAVVRDLISIRGIPLAPTQETKTQTSLHRLTSQVDLLGSAAS